MKSIERRVGATFRKHMFNLMTFTSLILKELIIVNYVIKPLARKNISIFQPVAQICETRKFWVVTILVDLLAIYFKKI